ncbi:hypothetical protein [Paenibacillus sp. NEAU-GSW1]|uniref:hypothetical protein n=1 Tax=Paenibacillus sp. NEAU-GSW1 TaxID=2682486 RepID=UPI0012E2C98E|nr:hypothetical protein [Paenibacillus sp. NEAU-GSW1]MUT67098.1 hypothetical protein [Paenibacillus sp. NEAU-GSW1]
MTKNARFRFTTLFLLAILLMSSTALSAFAEPEESFTLVESPESADSDLSNVPDLSDEPEVVVESLDKNGKPVENTDVVVKSLSDDSGIVFTGKTDKKGQIRFKSKVSAEQIASAPGNAADAVYEIWFSSPDNELSREVVAVPHIKDRGKAEPNTLKELEKSRKKLVKTIFKGEKKAPPKKEKQTAGQVQTLALVCEPLVGMYKACNKTDTTTSHETKIGSFNVSSNETVAFSMTSSAKVTINIGYKKNSDPWTYNGAVSLSSDTSTTVDYSVPGTCMYIGSSMQCNLTRDVYAWYKYRYQKYDVYYGNTYEWTENSVTPIELNGSSVKENWYSNGNNGKPYADVTASKYGAPFVIGNKGTSASTQKSYTSERSFTAGVSVSTPIGTFNSDVVTAYKSAHSIKWTAGAGYTFAHYDMDNTGRNWYVTKG